MSDTKTLSALSDGITAAVETASASTLLVDARRRFPASGIAYAADLILTADHVVTRDEDIRIGLPDGKSLPATIAGRDPGSDLALLRLSEKALTPAKTDKNPKVGQIALALGRPSEAGMQASFGIITSINGPARTWRGGLLDQFLQTETVPYPGFSGGPLVNANGEVLGLNTSGLTRGEALTIPISVAWPIAESLAQHGTVKRGYLGVRTQPVENGLLILWLEKGGPAEQSGLLVGDILVKVNGQRLDDSDALFAALNSDVVGKKVDVELLRGGQSQSLKVTVGERK
ncbi:MAG TPA: trypsin-like peptidase domain-containing protein [Anaerolineales bacterium]|nr:trypsin-like peptidase domain-containing protein [Anaerolineales bacterium]